MKVFLYILMILNFGYLSSCGDSGTIFKEKEVRDESTNNEEDANLNEEEEEELEQVEEVAEEPEDTTSVTTTPGTISPGRTPVEVTKPPVDDPKPIIPEQFELLGETDSKLFCLDTKNSMVFSSEEHEIKSCESAETLPEGLSLQVNGNDCVLEGTLSSAFISEGVYRLTLNALDIEDRIGSVCY